VRASHRLTHARDGAKDAAQPPQSGSAFCAWCAESPQERAKVAAFVDSVYNEAFGAAPPLADAYAAINFEGELVCCIGLDWEGPDGRFGIERAYRLDRAMLPLPITGGLQFGRWASKMPRAGRFAIYAAAVFGLARGRSVVLVEHDATVHRHCERLGIVFYDIAHHGVDLSTIPEAGQPHYSKGDMHPYLARLDQIRSALEASSSALTFSQ
jgi:hypothetical protein